MSEVVVTPLADRSLFSLHEEEEVVEIPPHRLQVEYVETNLRVELPRRFVAGNMGVYWVPGQLQEPWVGPEVLVGIGPRRDPPPRVYLLWEDGPILFIAEVASDRTRRSERDKRELRYRVDLKVPEYLYIDLDRHELELWRLRGGAYRRVSEQADRLYSRQLDMWFGWGPDEEFVRIWTADGRMLLTKEEEREQNLRLAAELDAVREEADRADAERKAAVDQARAAETHAAELAAELERLRRGGNGDANPAEPA